MNKVYILFILIALSFAKDIKYNGDCKVANSVFQCNINMNDTIVGYDILFNSSIYIGVRKDINNIPFIRFSVNNHQLKLPIQNDRYINMCVPIPILYEIHYGSVSLCLKLTDINIDPLSFNISIILKISLLNPIYLYGPKFIVLGDGIYL